MMAKIPADKWSQRGLIDEWAPKDVIAHLAHWEEMQISWTDAANRGEKPEVPGPGLTFGADDLAVLNRRIYEAHCDQTFEQILAYFRETHQRFIAQLEAMAAEVLVQKGYASFAHPKRALVQYYVNYAFHDNWAKQLLYKNVVRKPRTKK